MLARHDCWATDLSHVCSQSQLYCNPKQFWLKPEALSTRQRAYFFHLFVSCHLVLKILYSVSSQEQSRNGRSSAYSHIAGKCETLWAMREHRSSPLCSFILGFPLMWGGAIVWAVSFHVLWPKTIMKSFCFISRKVKKKGGIQPKPKPFWFCHHLSGDLGGNTFPWSSHYGELSFKQQEKQFWRMLWIL